MVIYVRNLQTCPISFNHLSLKHCKTLLSGLNYDEIPNWQILNWHRQILHSKLSHKCSSIQIVQMFSGVQIVQMLWFETRKLTSRPTNVKSWSSKLTLPSVRWSLRKEEQKDFRLVVDHLLVGVHQDVVHHLLLDHLGDHHLRLRATLWSHWRDQLLRNTIM